MAGRGVAALPLAAFFDVVARLAGAIVVAFVAIAILKSRRGGIVAFAARAIVAALLAALGLWMAYAAFPYPALAGAQAISLVATAVFVTGLLAEELIGADVRRMLGL